MKPWSRRRLSQRRRWRKQSFFPGIPRRLPGFDFRSKPYQEFSLNLDEQLACLVGRWRPRDHNDLPDCPAQESTSELGL